MKILYSLRLIVYHSLWSIESGLMVGENDKMDSLFSGSRICRAIWLQRICAASLSTQLQIETTFTVSHRYYWKNMWIKTLSTIQAIRLKEDIFRPSLFVTWPLAVLWTILVRGRLWRSFMVLVAISVDTWSKKSSTDVIFRQNKHYVR